jgi:hypothetical protein
MEAKIFSSIFDLYICTVKKIRHCDKIPIMMFKNAARPTGYNKKKKGSTLKIQNAEFQA